ncbi:hypothetical protein BH23PLA1_BH23PLA1_02470 [soil metagenome]
MAHRADALNRWQRAIVPLLIVYVLAMLGGLLWAPLPNVSNVGGELRRSLFLMAAIPGLVPDLAFQETLLGQALQQLSQLENLPQRLPLMLASALIAGAALGLGRLLLLALGMARRLSILEVLPLSFGLGVVGLGAITLGLGRLGVLDPWVFRLGLGALLLVGWALPTCRFLRNQESIAHPTGIKTGPALGFLLIVGPFLLLMALGALQPTIEYDALEYHLQGPKEFYQAGQIAFLPHNVYTSMPFGIEMLHLLGMVVRDDWWSGALVGQLLIAAFAPATAWLIFLTARRLGSARAGWIAAVVYLTTPWVFRLATYPFVEGPLCFFHAALIWTIVNSRPDFPSPTSNPHLPNPLSNWALAGLLAGGAMICKYPGLVSAVIPFGALAMVVAWRRRSWKILLAFALGVALAVAPWLIRNVIDTGNPVYPLAFDIFGGDHWDEELDEKWWRAHGPRPLTIGALVVGGLDVAGRSDWQSPLYALLVPLALLRPGSRRSALALWGYGLYLFATWFLLTHRLDRFWLPLLPSAAILAGLGADWTRGRGWSIVLAVVLGIAISANLAFVSTPLSGPVEWTTDLDDLRRQGPDVLSLPEQPSPLARLDAVLPAEARVLMIGQAGVFHQRHELRYNTVFNRELLEEIAAGRSPEDVGKHLTDRGLTHIYVDWVEVERHRKPGGYGFTPFVTRELFEDFQRIGLLEPPDRLGDDHWLYRVRSAGPGSSRVRASRRFNEQRGDVGS